jgi:hypothetical protein
MRLHVLAHLCDGVIVKRDDWLIVHCPVSP